MAAENGGAPPLLNLSKDRAISAPCSAPSGKISPFSRWAAHPRLGRSAGKGLIRAFHGSTAPFPLCERLRGCRRRVEAPSQLIDSFFSDTGYLSAPSHFSASALKSSSSKQSSRKSTSPNSKRRVTEL